MNKFLPLIMGILFSVGLYAQSDLIISEYVEGWSTNKAIEVYNPTSSAINLSGYRLVRYANGEDVPPAEDDWTVTLPDVSLEPYKAYVCVLDKRNPEGTGQEAPIWEQLEARADVFLCPVYSVSNTLYHNGNDAIALEKTDGTLVDLLGRWGAPAPSAAAVGGSTSTLECWTDTAPYFTGVGVGITADHTLYRRSNITTGVTTNPSMFNPLAEWDSLSANTFNYLGWHKCDVAPANQTPSFNKEAYEFKIWRQAAEGTVLGTVAATDAESNALRYYINTGNYVYNQAGDGLTPFEMDRETGKITLINPTAIKESTWDTLYIKISVTDGYSESDWVTAVTILSDTELSYDQFHFDDLQIYPNPVKSNEITILGAKEMNTISLINISGQVNNIINVSGKKTSLNIEAQPIGVYFVKVEYSDGTSDIQRIVKE